MTTRNKKRKDYKKIHDFGFQSSDESEDILEVSDPNSDIFDNENEAKSVSVGIKADKVDKIRKEIEALTLDITQTERELEQKQQTLYDKQGARPKTKSSTPLDVNKSASVTGEGQKDSTGQKKQATKKRVKTSGKKKSKSKKGEINLNDLRSNEILNALTEKQLSELSQKGKIKSLLKSRKESRI